MAIKDDVTSSGSNIVLTVLNNPKLARVYSPEEVADLIEALAAAANEALDHRYGPLPSYENDLFKKRKNSK